MLRRMWRLFGCILLAVTAWHGSTAAVAQDNIPAADSQTASPTVAEVFRGQPVPLDDERVQPLRELLEDLRVGFRDRDQERIGKRFDAVRMLREAVRSTDIKLDQAQFARGLEAVRARIAEQFAKNAQFYAFERAEVKRVEFNERADQAVLYVRSWDAEGTTAKVRWWAALEGGIWRAYDFEDLSAGMRISVLSGTIMAAAEALPANWRSIQRDALLLNQAIVAAHEDDFETVASLLNRSSFADSPPPIRAAREMFLGLAAIANDDSDQALEMFAHAEQLHPDLVVLGYLRAIVYNRQEKHAEAAREARAFLEQLGGDADASVELVAALRGLDRHEEALAALRDGLDDDPSSVELLVMLAPALPAEDKREMGERFLKLRDPAESFESVCSELWDDPDAVLAVAAAYRTLNPDDPDIAYYSADALLSKERAQEAFALLAAVLPATKDREDHDAFVSLFSTAAVAAGKTVEAYQQADDKPQMFRDLSGDLLYEEEVDRDAFRRLVELHRTAFPEDPELFYALGELAYRDEEWKAAVDAYRRCLELDPEDPDDRFRYSLIFALFHDGRAMEALRTVPPAGETFRQLMELGHAADPRPTEQMAALLEEHATGHPNDAAVGFWSIRLAYDAGEHERAAKLLDQHAGVLARDEDFDYSYFQLKVHVLIASNRLIEAAREARLFADRYGDPILRAVVAAARGDVHVTDLWLAECLKSGYEPFEFYEEEILGDKLRLPEFESLRKKYPPGADVQEP